MIFPTGIFLVHMTLLLSKVVTGDQTSPHTECVVELVAEFVAFSPCFPVVADPPNNFITAVSPKCSDAITFRFIPTGNGSFCIGYVLQHPQIFDFPSNISRVLLLPFVCWGNTTRSPESTTVECSGEFVSELEEAIRECSMVIIGSCVDKQEQRCWGLCEKHLPSKKQVDASYKVINGSLLCYRHGIYPDKPVECREAVRDRYMPIKTTCNSTPCCFHKVCKNPQQPVYYKVINGTPMCYCPRT